MKFYTCPYEPRACNSTTSKLVPELGKPLSIQTHVALFAQNSICYWTIKAKDYNDGTPIPNNTLVEIKANKMQSV